MIQVNTTLTEVEKRTLNRMTMQQLAQYCANVERQIETSNNKKEIKGLQSHLSQCDLLFNNRLEREK